MNPHLAHKRQHVQRGRARLKSRAYYRRHRTKILTESRRRYRKLRHNPQFKRRRKLYHLHPERYHRIKAAWELSGAEFWSPDWGAGEVRAVGPEGELYVALGEEGIPAVVDWEDLLDTATFLDPEGLDWVVGELDRVFGVEPEFCAVSNAMAAREEVESPP